MSVKGNHVKIVTPEFSPYGTKVFVDGMEIHQVTNVEFKHRVESPPTVLIEFYPKALEMEGEAMAIMEPNE